ncbi:RDD family protein [Alcanivorax sp. 1008]|uniref:RDD family protein n=1 Tax=Alcanivorax sp. 1008 TaxID=2816853 RepID=UPI001E058BD8|nr:RDD family protein [Alcanivorax sp. 1008]MCC1497490.1 RDD family protein [Alcanivorax sp. 1008]
MTNPYQTPTSQVAPDDSTQGLEYGGFWRRTGASLIDTILILLVTSPVLYAFYGHSLYTEQSMLRGPADFIISYLFPAIASIAFWVYKSATPGKMALGLKIVDADTAGPCSTGQLIGRYLGYYVSIVALCLGFLWVAFDKRKQGWHDKLAGTLVIRTK